MLTRRSLLQAAPAALLASCTDGSDKHGIRQGAVAVGGIVTGPERTLRALVSGSRRHGHDEPVEVAHRWHIGSNAKAMTAVLYASLVEQGRAGWDMTAGAAFPGLAMHAAWRSVPLTAFLSHSSGLSDRGLLGAWRLINSELDERPLPKQRRGFVAEALADPPAGTAGKFEYANANYVLVGSAIERITGAPWEEAMKRLLFEPLGLASAGFGPPGAAQPWGHKARFFGLGPRRAVAPGPAADNPPFLFPAGAVHLSLEDYARFLRLFLTGGAGLLKPETIRRLTTPTPAGSNYALGWGVREATAAGGQALAHEGSNTMWYASCLVAPRLGLAAAAVSNDGTATGAAATRSLVRKLMRGAGGEARGVPVKA
jgi:CubicO group peptidase (beta-lactamase class C family)